MTNLLKMCALGILAFGLVACSDVSASGDDKGRANNAQKASKALEKLCNEGVSEVCLKFAEKYKDNETKALAYYEKGCNGKDKYNAISKSCLAIAYIYAQKLEGDKAKPYYAKACENGTCHDKLKELDESLYLDSHIKYAEKSNDWSEVYKYIKNIDDETHKEKVLQVLTKSCENSNAGACLSCYQYSSDINTKELYAKRICEIGSIKDCSEIETHSNTYSENDEIRFSLYPIVEKRCLNGEVEFCKKILNLYNNMNKTIETVNLYLKSYGKIDWTFPLKDYVSGREYSYSNYDKIGGRYEKIISNGKIASIEAHYKNLCKSSNAKECKEQQPKQNMSQEVLAQSCENGDGKSCDSLGDIYKEKLDGKQAKAYYQKGCEYGNYDACGSLSFLEKDKEKLVSTFKKICDNSVGMGCYYLGKIYEKNENYKQAIAPYAKACELGNAVDGDKIIGCWDLKDVYGAAIIGGVNGIKLESEAYWLGYHRGDSKKAKQSVKEVRQMRNEVRGEFLKYLPNLCKIRGGVSISSSWEGNTCELLWKIGNY